MVTDLKGNVSQFPRTRTRYWDEEQLIRSYMRNENCQVRIYQVSKKGFAAIEVRQSWRDRHTGEWKAEGGFLAMTLKEWLEFANHLKQLK